MPTDDTPQAERAELDAVLASETFARSPIVAQMLRYICERHFNGQAREIKEYNIAVEAFGRPANFDQTRDSIVRVEAHRLRKRLQEYYLQQGASHQIQIILPPGNYVPQFVRRPAPGEAAAEKPATTATATGAEKPAPASQKPAAGEPAGEKAVPPLPVPPPQTAAASPAAPAPPAVPTAELARTQPAVVPVAGRVPPWLRWGAPALLVLAVLTGLYLSRNAVRTVDTAPAPARATALPAPALPPGEEVRLLAGSDAPSFTDHHGNTWLGDRFFQGGDARSVSPRPIANTQDPAIYLHRRQGNFTYNIPLKKGVYEMRLYFAETVFGENNVGGGGETTRVFKIHVNGSELLHFLDVDSDAGGSNTADIKVFKDIQPADDGMLHLAFLTIDNELPFVNGIEIVPSQPGRIRPIRFLARSTGYTDSRGRFWGSDQYFRSGVQVQRHDEVANTDDETLYQFERFGNFSYIIPVAAQSRYTVTLRFCEAWFGPERPASGGAGGRVFNVSFNGRILLDHFDVFKEAGSLRALEKTFKALEPNAQGKLIFSFAPLRNYAMVNAVEVVDEGGK